MSDDPSLAGGEIVLTTQFNYEVDRIRERNRLAKRKWRQRQHQASENPLSGREDGHSPNIPLPDTQSAYHSSQNLGVEPYTIETQFLTSPEWDDETATIRQAMPMTEQPLNLGPMRMRDQELMIVGQGITEGPPALLPQMSGEPPMLWMENSRFDASCNTPSLGESKDHTTYPLVNDSFAAISEASDKQNILHVAVCNGSLGIIQILLEAGADCNIWDANGFSPLHIAVRYRKLAIVRLLINNGADINAVDSAGKTSLELAVRIQDEEMVHFLVSAGARVR